MPRIALAVAFPVAASALSAEDQMPRTELGRTETTATSETIVTELHMMPGAYLKMHTHPGDEHVYIVKGGPMTTKDGRTVAFEDGGYLYFPRGQVHGGLTAAGDGEVVILTVHVVDKGKPVYAFTE